MVAVCAPLLQDNVYTACADKAPVEFVCAFAHASPVHEVLIFLPVRVQLVTLVALHEITEEFPERMRDGEALI